MILFPEYAAASGKLGFHGIMVIFDRYGACLNYEPPRQALSQGFAKMAPSQNDSIYIQPIQWQTEHIVLAYLPRPALATQWGRSFFPYDEVVDWIEDSKKKRDEGPHSLSDVH